jgi:hypothetical protein
MWKLNCLLTKAVPVCVLKKRDELSQQIFGFVQVLRLKSNC